MRSNWSRPSWRVGEMVSVQASHRDGRFMEDIKGVLKSKNYTVSVRIRGDDIVDTSCVRLGRRSQHAHASGAADVELSGHGDVGQHKHHSTVHHVSTPTTLSFRYIYIHLQHLNRAYTLQCTSYISILFSEANPAETLNSFERYKKRIHVCKYAYSKGRNTGSYIN